VSRMKKEFVSITTQDNKRKPFTFVDRWHCQICGKNCFLFFCGMNHLRQWSKREADMVGT